MATRGKTRSLRDDGRQRGPPLAALDLGIYAIALVSEAPSIDELAGPGVSVGAEFGPMGGSVTTSINTSSDGLQCLPGVAEDVGFAGVQVGGGVGLGLGAAFTAGYGYLWRWW